MKIAFITEMGFAGKVPADYRNMRTEFAWMHALDADHFGFYTLDRVADYDHVFIIFPKGQFNLNAVGSKIANLPNPYSGLLATDWLKKLKEQNRKVYYVQEGPSWMFTELEVADQIHFYNMLVSVDAILVHNVSDIQYYRGLVPNTPIHVLRSLMIENTIKDIKPEPEDKAIIGGNFARWYGGFESFIVAGEFGVPIHGQTSHAMRDGEDQVFPHLPRVLWTDWINQLSTFKYAVHLMPTVAAGTFSLNCAYLGIPCIGNKKLDTQLDCHPSLGVDVNDVEAARNLARKLKEDKKFYRKCSEEAKENYKKYYSLESWKKNMNFILNLK
jgi:hypothetical protein